MNKNIVRELELIIEMNDLRELGMTEEEVLGFFEFYYESWEIQNDQNCNN